MNIDTQIQFQTHIHKVYSTKPVD